MHTFLFVRVGRTIIVYVLVVESDKHLGVNNVWPLGIGVRRLVNWKILD